MIDVAVCVLTLNEEEDIVNCLRSLSLQFTDIHVVDSLSTDNTIINAQRFTKNIYINRQEPPYSASTQRNWALRNISTNAKFVLFIDADETLPPNFASQLSRFLLANKSFKVIAIPLLFILYGQEIKSMGFPNWHDRLVDRDINFVSDVGEFADSSSRIFFDDSYIKHHFNSKGLSRFWEKQIRYSSFIGNQLFLYRNGHPSFYFKKQGSSGKLKRFASHFLWSRPFLRFFYHYLLKLGFIEGRSGLICALNMAIFEYFVLISFYESSRRNRNLLL